MTRDRVLTDPLIAAAVGREKEALHAWTHRGRSTSRATRRRLEKAYLYAFAETTRLLRARPRLDPLAPGEEVPS